MAEPAAAKPRQERSGRRGSRSAASSPTAKELSRQRYDSPFDASLVAARKRSQQERLWEIFTAYALQLSSEDPTRIRIANVVKLLQDCGIIDGNDTEEAKMIEKEVSIVCESFLKTRPSTRDSGKKLDFTAFLDLLLHFAKMSGDRDPSRAYDSLVRTCLEKQQKPRVRVAVAEELQDCRKVLTSFEDPLAKIFAHYAAQTLAKQEKMDPKMALLSPPHLGYAECVAFGRQYGIIALGVLTTTEFATIYIDSLPKAPVTEYHRVLSYDSFCEMLVRLSRKACVDEALPAERNLKGLFQLMWLASASSSPRALKITDVLKTDRVDVTKHFLIQFEKLWKKDNYENYFGDRPGMPCFVAVPAAVTPSASASASPPKPAMPRRLSLNVQRSASSSGQPKTLQRKFSMQSPPSPTQPRAAEATN